MEKLPLEILKEKYIPIVAFPERYNISVEKVQSLIDSHQIRYAEFKAPGETRRSVHVNYEEVLAILEESE